jgi:DNA replication protein DnaC
MLSHPLLPKLRSLQLSGMTLTLEARSAQAVAGSLTPTEFLALLLDDELERRQGQRLKRSLVESGIDQAKTLAGFDFLAVPQLNRSLVMELGSCGFVGRAENVLVCGPTGTGKSHLVNALGFEGLRRGHSVLLRTAHRLLADLNAARADGTFARRLAKVCQVDLLILDDFGLRPLSSQAAEDLYEIVRERYERRSTAITSNRAFQEWPEVFGDGLLSSAALDRLTHHCHMLVIRGQSYRQRSRRKEGAAAEEPFPGTRQNSMPEDLPREF